MNIEYPAVEDLSQSADSSKRKDLKTTMLEFISSLPIYEENNHLDKLSKGSVAELRRAIYAFLGLGVEGDNRLIRLTSLFGFINKFNIPILVKDALVTTQELNSSMRWALWMLCSITLKDKHEQGVKLGKALAEVEYSQSRFLKLLGSRDMTFVKEMISAANVIKNGKSCIDLIELGYFIILKSDDKKLAIANDYYKNLNINNKENS